MQKKFLAVAVYNHYKRILTGSNFDVELQKSNVFTYRANGIREKHCKPWQDY